MQGESVESNLFQVFRQNGLIHRQQRLQDVADASCILLKTGHEAICLASGMLRGSFYGENRYRDCRQNVPRSSATVFRDDSLNCESHFIIGQFGQTCIGKLRYDQFCRFTFIDHR
jgi:hypothetical protein